MNEIHLKTLTTMDESEEVITALYVFLYIKLHLLDLFNNFFLLRFQWEIFKRLNIGFYSYEIINEINKIQ